MDGTKIKVNKRIRLFFYGIYYVIKMRPISILYFLLTVSFAFFPFLNAKLFASLIDGFAHGKPAKVILFSLACYIALKIALNILSPFNGYIFTVVKKAVDNEIRVKVVKAVGRFNTLHFEDEKWLFTINRMDKISTALTDLFKALADIVSQLFMAASYIIYLFSLIHQYALIGILVIIPPFFQSLLISKIKYELMRKLNPKNQREGAIRNMFFNPQAAKEIRLYKAESLILTRWKKLYAEIFKERYRIERIFAFVDIGIAIFSAGIMSILMIMLYLNVASGLVTAGTLLSLLPFMLSVTRSFDKAMMTFHSVIYSQFEWEELNRFFEESESVKEKAYSAACSPIQISVNNITFSYPNNDRKILNEVSFDIYPGEKVALIGVNGAGKSTLLKVLAGIYSAQSGDILYNGVSVNAMEDTMLQKNISFVFQTPLQYPLSLEENIFMDNPDRQAVDDIIKQTGIPAEEIKSRGNILTHGFSQSTNLSGGQWQRIAIARALINKKADIYIFDEPTAALDPLAEVEVFKLFRSMTRDKTVIVSTHRLGIAKEADKIIVLDHNGIDSVGSHEELMLKSMVYRNLYNAQADWYMEVTA